ncbi:hypothetical protein BZA77DRAFT_357837 [Pyronema omphalodes]|nr:hypothetical protein BZA77DRAFT_357837 [Pyronema omphalodes]
MGAHQSSSRHKRSRTASNPPQSAVSQQTSSEFPHDLIILDSQGNTATEGLREVAGYQEAHGGQVSQQHQWNEAQGTFRHSTAEQRPFQYVSPGGPGLAQTDQPTRDPRFNSFQGPSNVYNQTSGTRIAHPSGHPEYYSPSAQPHVFSPRADHYLPEVPAHAPPQAYHSPQYPTDSSQVDNWSLLSQDMPNNRKPVSVPGFTPPRSLYPSSSTSGLTGSQRSRSTNSRRGLSNMRQSGTVGPTELGQRRQQQSTTVAPLQLRSTTVAPLQLRSAPVAPLQLSVPDQQEGLGINVDRFKYSLSPLSPAPRVVNQKPSRELTTSSLASTQPSVVKASEINEQPRHESGEISSSAISSQAREQLPDLDAKPAASLSEEAASNEPEKKATFWSERGIKLLPTSDIADPPSVPMEFPEELEEEPEEEPEPKFFNACCCACKEVRTYKFETGFMSDLDRWLIMCDACKVHTLGACLETTGNIYGSEGCKIVH